jgi:hypothetical protein
MTPMMFRVFCLVAIALAAASMQMKAHAAPSGHAPPNTSAIDRVSGST